MRFAVTILRALPGAGRRCAARASVQRCAIVTSRRSTMRGKVILSLGILCSILPTLGRGAFADNCSATVCGDGVTDTACGEECDDGGACIGSTNAGNHCTAARQCPGGDCKTFGGDGCASNCTRESDVLTNLIPGQLVM